MLETGRKGRELHRALSSPEGLRQGQGQVGYMEEELSGLQLEGQTGGTFWRDEESVLNRRDCLGQGLAFVALVNSPERDSALLEVPQ